METLNFSDPGLGRVMDTDSPGGLSMPKYPVVCLSGSGTTDSWFSFQRDDLGARVWAEEQASAAAGSARGWAESAAVALKKAEKGPVHIVATGPDVLGAVILGSTHPGLVMSLILGDPEVDPQDLQLAGVMSEVQAPTLVIAAAPTLDTDISKAQSVAGGIRNGVFVIIDHCGIPAHRNRPGSFNEWATSFIKIAEGLHAFARPEKDGNA